MKWIKKLGWLFQKQYQRLFYWLEWRFSDERKNPYRCTECGSTDIELKVWSKVNEGGRYSGDCEEYQNSYCYHCNKNVRIRPTSNLIEDTENWWKSLDLLEMKHRAGYLQSDFSPENEYPDFVNACNKWWHKLSTGEKIQTWLRNPDDILALKTLVIRKLEKLGYPSTAISSITDESDEITVIIDGKPHIVVKIINGLLADVIPAKEIGYHPITRNLQMTARDTNAEIYLISDGYSFLWLRTNDSGRPESINEITCKTLNKNQ